MSRPDYDMESNRRDAEYAQGVAEGNRFVSDCAIYGEALAEQWDFENEMQHIGDY